jgi:hypothetical protein
MKMQWNIFSNFDIVIKFLILKMVMKKIQYLKWPTFHITHDQYEKQYMYIDHRNMQFIYKRWLNFIMLIMD